MKNTKSLAQGTGRKIFHRSSDSTVTAIRGVQNTRTVIYKIIHVAQLSVNAKGIYCRFRGKPVRLQFEGSCRA